MPKQIVNIGLTPGDGSGDNIRDAFDKIQENFDEIWENLSTNGIDLRVSRIAKTGSYDDLINRPNPLAGSSAGEGGIIVGPRGPEGDPGPAGPQGEQGPPGLDLIDDTITTFITSWSSSRISTLIDTLDDLSQTIRRATATPPPPAPDLLPPGPGSAPLPSDAVFLERFNSIPMSRAPEIAPTDWEWFNGTNIINSFATGEQTASPLYPGFLTTETSLGFGGPEGGVAFYSTQSYSGDTEAVEVTNFSKIYLSVSYLPHDPEDFSWNTEASLDLQQTLECLTITDLKRISLTVRITRAVDIPSEYDLEVTRVDEIGELFATISYTNRFTQRLTDLPQNLVFELDLTQSDITTNITGTGRSSFYDSSSGSWVEVSNPAGGVVVENPPFSIGQMYVLSTVGSFVDYLLMGESNNEVAYRPVRTPVPEYASTGSLVFMEDFNTYFGYRLGDGGFEQALWDENSNEAFLQTGAIPSYAPEGSNLLLTNLSFGLGIDEYTDQQGRAYAFGYQMQRYFSDPIDFTEDYRVIDDVERIGARLVRVPVGVDGDISGFFGDITVQVAIHFEGPIIRGFGKYFFTFTEASGYTQHLPAVGRDTQIIIEDPNLGILSEAFTGGSSFPTPINVGDSFDFYIDVLPNRPSSQEAIYARFVIGDEIRDSFYDNYQAGIDNPGLWETIALTKVAISVRVINGGFLQNAQTNTDNGFNPFVIDYFYGQNRNGDLNLGAV